MAKKSSSTKNAPVYEDDEVSLGSNDTDESESEDDEEEGEASISDEMLNFKLDPQGRTLIDTPLNYGFRAFNKASVISSKDLQDDMKLAMTARSVDESAAAQYSSGETFFLPALMKPRCGLEKLAADVFKFHSSLCPNFNPETSGAEWWTQVIETSSDIGAHWDKDYELEEQVGVNCCPHVATVTYFSDVGGPTVVLEHVSGQRKGDDFSGELF
jgi:hypothetical protein